MAASDSNTVPAASPSGTKLSWLATLAMRPVNPASISVVMTPSDTPPVRLVSSATSTRPGAAGPGGREQALDRQGGKPAGLEYAAVQSVCRERAGRPQAEPEAVPEGNDRQVLTVAVQPAAAHLGVA